MKKFIINIFLFNMPIVFLIGACLYILYYTGEIYSKEDIIKPLDENQLIGLAYSDINEPYKIKMCDMIFQPDIIALGSSRIMQVKKNIISSKYTFYNSGGAVNNIYQYKFFLDNIKAYPNLFIISIDQWFFNPNYANQELSFDKTCYILPESHLDLARQCTNLINDLFLGKIDFQKIFDYNNYNIGINAIINKNGFTSDGSYYYGGIIKAPSESADYNFKNTYERIAHGDRRFQYCNKADTTVKEAVASFLSDCEKNKISVIAILPPFAPLIYKKMEQTKRYKYMSQIYNILLPIFEKYKNCYLFDYTDTKELNVHNYDFIDGFHGSELVYNQIIKDIIKKNGEVSKYFKSSSTIDSINIQYKNRGIRYHDFE